MIRPNGRSPLQVRELSHERLRKLFVMGLPINLLNPKRAVVYLSRLPRFTEPEFRSVPLQALFLRHAACRQRDDEFCLHRLSCYDRRLFHPATALERRSAVADGDGAGGARDPHGGRGASLIASARDCIVRRL